MRVLYLIFLFPFHISSSGGYKFKIEVAVKSVAIKVSTEFNSARNRDGS